MDSQEHETTHTEVSNLASALCKAQGMMSGAKKDKVNPFFKSNYADLSSVFEAIRVPFSENGLAVSQIMDVMESGTQILCTRLLHKSGEYLDSRMILPTESNPQKLGSLITYYRRYALMSIAGIPAEDDDGNAASNKVSAPAPQYISSAQVDRMEDMLDGHPDIRQVLTSSMGKDLSKLSVDRYPAAIKWIDNLIDTKEGPGE